MVQILIVDEELEGLVQLVVDVLRLASFDDEVGDDGVDAKVQLLDRLFAVFGSGNKIWAEINFDAEVNVITEKTSLDLTAVFLLFVFDLWKFMNCYRKVIEVLTFEKTNNKIVT